jgi:hypothetical protein
MGEVRSTEGVMLCHSSSDDEGSTMVLVTIRLVFMGDRSDTPRFDVPAGASELDPSVSESEVVGACVADAVLVFFIR